MAVLSDAGIDLSAYSDLSLYLPSESSLSISLSEKTAIALIRTSKQAIVIFVKIVILLIFIISPPDSSGYVLNLRSLLCETNFKTASQTFILRLLMHLIDR